MRILRAGLVSLMVVVIAGGMVVGLTEPRIGDAFRRVAARQPHESRKAAAGTRAVAPRVPLLSARFVDDSGFQVVGELTPRVGERCSLEEFRSIIRTRAEAGRASLIGQLARSDDGPRAGQDLHRAEIQTKIAMTFMYEGRFTEVAPWLEKAVAENPGIPADLKANLLALRGIAALRRGEIENCVACVGPSSCIFPIAPEARHRQISGSREAMGHFIAYLKHRPEDFGVRWLLSIAAMTLGEYPDGVPAELRLPTGLFASASDIGRFPNIAAGAGLNSRGPNMFGGSLFDDFTGDGLPDIFVSSADCDLDAALFVNRGDRFEDRGATAGLTGQTLAANASHADFDNDGRLDVLLIRGGWDAPRPLSLLRNKGEGTFEDVTAAAGLAEPIQSQSACWRDFDNDGFVDLYVVGEQSPQNSDPRCVARLYRNNGNGTFTDVAESAGVTNDRFGKGAAWGDYDGDGWPDLYVSNMQGANRLYHNNGDGTFIDVAPELGVTEPIDSFSCWFWDYDNDGRLDLFVAGFHGFVYDVIADALGQPNTGEFPRLYRNLGKEGFRDVTREVGLGRVFLTMGSNFGDVDNDGYLDIYLGTGRPNYSALVPNVMLKNVGGRRFEDVSVSSGTAHLQKGHGISFADWDGDGDLDLFAQMGGATPGDRAYNALFQNPGHGRHWLAVKLIGTATNRAAIGARLRVDITGPDGKARSIFREVSSGSSYGGNGFTQHIGLDVATKVTALEVNWPTSHTSQAFHDVPADRTVEITEGAEPYKTPYGTRAPRPGEH
jgi:FG-GAP-like repeat/ASPIC and UnbV